MWRQCFMVLEKQTVRGGSIRGLTAPARRFDARRRFRPIVERCFLRRFRRRLLDHRLDRGLTLHERVVVQEHIHHAEQCVFARAGKQLRADRLAAVKSRSACVVSADDDDTEARWWGCVR